MSWASARGIGVTAIALLAACTELRVVNQTGGGPDDPGEPTEPSDVEAGADAGKKGKDASSPADAGADAASPLVCDGPCPVVDLVDMGGFKSVTIVTVDATNMYFAVGNDDTVHACPKSGCTTTTLLGTGYTFNIVALGGQVYWGDFSTGKLWKCAAGGCNSDPVAIAVNQISMRGVWTDGADLYWSAGGNVMRCAPSSCTPQVVRAGVGDVTTLAVDQGKVFWEDPSSSIDAVHTCPVASCTSPSLFGTGTHSVNTSAGQVFWGNDGTIATCPVTGCTGPQKVFAVADLPTSPVSDGTNVYFRDAQSYRILRCPSSGCFPGPDVLATMQLPSSKSNVAVDDLYVYWGSDGAVRRVPK